MDELLRVVDASAPWLACLRRPSGANEVHLFVSDLRRFFSCTCGESDLRRQLDATDLASPVDKMLDVLMRCFAGSDPASSAASFQVRPPVDALGQLLHLDFYIRGTLKVFSFPCHSVADPGASVRDELLLPMMRAAEQLRQLVPAGAAWSPPAGALPLPAFDASLMATVLEHARRPSDAQASATGPAGAEGGEAAAAAADAVAETPADSGFGPSASTSTSATVPEDEGEQRRKRAQEARERAASKKNPRVAPP